MIYGKTLSYEPSRFISEIPAEYLEEREAKINLVLAWAV